MRGEQAADGVWSIRAEATLQQAYADAACPLLLKRALSGSYTWQNRNRRQVQRTLVSASIAPQWTAALLAMAAKVTVQEGVTSMQVPLEDVLERRVQGTPMILHVRSAGICCGESHVGRTPADEPIVAAFAAVELTERRVCQARVALTGVWPKPVGLAHAAANLIGGPLDAEGIVAVARAVAYEVAPDGDFRGSVEYRRAMAQVLTRRALERCLAAAAEEVDNE